MKNLMNYKETAEYLGIALGTVYSMVHRRQIPHHRLGGRLVRFDPEELRTWLDARAIDDSRLTEVHLDEIGRTI